MSGAGKTIKNIFFSVGAVVMATGINACALKTAPITEDKASVSIAVSNESGDKADAQITVEVVCEQAPDPAILFDEIVKERLAGRLSSAQGRLEDIRKRFPGSIWAARASFLLGMDGVEKADADGGGERVEAFFREAATLAQVQDYALYFRGRAFARSKKYFEAVAAYDQMLELYPSSVLRAEVIYRKAGTLLDSGDAGSARRLYAEYAEKYPKSSRIPDVLLGIGKASLLLGDGQLALKSASRLLIQYPGHRVARGAADIVSQLRSAGGVIPEYTVEERFRRAHRLFDATVYGQAVKELERVEREAGPGELREKAIIKKAVALVRLKEYSKVEGLLERYLSSKRPSGMDAEALYWLSLSALRQGKAALIEKSLKELSARFPSSPERAGVLLFMGRYYEGSGDFDSAIGFFQQVATLFPQSPLAQDAVWSIGWLNYRAGRYAEASTEFAVYLDAYPAGKDAVKVLYWMARSLEKIGDSGGALPLYERICLEQADGYYCRMSAARLPSAIGSGPSATVLSSAGVAADTIGLKEPAPSEAVAGTNDQPGEILLELSGAAKDNDTAPGEGLFLDAHYLAAKELLVMGLGQYASAEIDAVATRYAGDKIAMREVALLFYSSGDYFRAFRVYKGHLADLPAVDSAHSLAYPASFVKKIREKAGGSADEYLVAAVAREESSFNPAAVSQTGAIGLMQIMPSTGRLISKGLGRPSFDSKELFDPEINFAFGSWYLGSLLKRFDNDMVLAIASYNAGPAAVERWMGVLPVSADEFIESIPYPETRNYAKKVLKSYLEFARRSGQARAEALRMPVGVRSGGQTLIEKKVTFRPEGEGA